MMRIALIGRSELLWQTAQLFICRGYEISLIITSKEAPEYSITAADFENLAAKIGAGYLYTGKLGDEKSLEFICAQGKSDIAVSVNYSGVIPESVIDCFELGILNAHGGDLPRYRGNACQAWAIINGEDKIGLCVHKMIGGELDNGKIIARDYMPLELSTKVGQCYDWMEQRIPSLFYEAVNTLAEDPEFVLEVQSTMPVDALRCYPRRPEDGCIDFHQSAEQVLRLINASGRPFAGAYGYYKGQKIIIHDARLYHDEERYLAIPGQIAKVNKDSGSVVVITGNGKLELLTVETTNGEQVPAKVVTGIRNRFC